MKKILGTFLLLATLFSFVSPAKADTSIYMGVSSGGRSHHHRPHAFPHRHVRYEEPRWHRPHHYRPAYYAPSYVVFRSQPVVYQTNYVAPPAPIVAATPVSDDYFDASGRQCREYQSTASVGGAPSVVYGTACLQPDGSWRVVN